VYKRQQYTVGNGGAFDNQISNIVDGNINSSAYMQGQGTNIEMQKVFITEPGGKPTQYRVCMFINFLDSNCGARAKFINSDTGTQTSTGTHKGPWRDYSSSWSNFRTEEADCWRTGSNPAGYALIGLVWVEVQYEYDDASPATGVVKVGAAIKIGTVDLIGNSVADTVIGGRVSADIKGYESDGSYGPSGSVIESPELIIKHFLIEHCGLTTSEIGTTYTQAGTDYDDNNITLAPVLLEKPNVREFISQIAFQARSIEYWEEGKHNLKWVPYTDTADKTIEAERIDIESLLLSYSPRAEILNKFVGAYNKEWIGAFGSSAYGEDIEAQRNIVLAESVTSQADFGVLEDEPYQLSFIRSESLAQRIINYIRDTRSQPRLIAEFTGGQYLMDFEKGDIFDFIFEADDELDRRLLGLVVSQSTQFRVIDTGHRGEGTIWIQGLLVVSSSTSSNVFYPSANSDDGYTQGANFYNDTLAIPIGDYAGSPVY